LQILAEVIVSLLLLLLFHCYVIILCSLNTKKVNALFTVFYHKHHYVNIRVLTQW